MCQIIVTLEPVYLAIGVDLVVDWYTGVFWMPQSWLLKYSTGAGPGKTPGKNPYYA